MASSSLLSSSSSSRLGMGAAVFYGVLSVAMTLLNKTVLSVYRFPFTATVLLVQLLFTVAVLRVLAARGAIGWRALSSRELLSVAPLAVAYAANVLAALAALSSLNVPMYNTLKRVTTLVTLVLERVFLGRSPSRAVAVSVFVIVGGALVAGAGDLVFDVRSYAFAMLSCVLQASYLLLVAAKGRALELNSHGLLYYNCALSAPLVALLVLVNDEVRAVASFEHLASPGFVGAFATSSAMGALLNYSMFLCATTTSPLTVTVVGQMKMVAATTLGMLLFPGTLITPLNALGLLINTCGSFAYSYAKYVESSKDNNSAAAAASASSTSDVERASPPLSSAHSS